MQVQHQLEMVCKCAEVWKIIDVHGDGRIFDSLGMQVPPWALHTRCGANPNPKRRSSVSCF